MQRLTVEVERCNAEIRAITEEMAGADSQIAVLQNDIAHNEATAADLERPDRAGEPGAQRAAPGDRPAQGGHCRAGRGDRPAGRPAGGAGRALQKIQAESEATEASAGGAVTGALAGLTERQTAAKVKAAGCKSAADTAAERLTAVKAEQEKSGETLAGPLRRSRRIPALI